MVGILMGSKSDLDVVRNAFDVLDSFGVPFKARILSAHRTPQEAAEFAENAEKNGRTLCNVCTLCSEETNIKFIFNTPYYSKESTISLLFTTLYIVKQH